MKDIHSYTRLSSKKTPCLPEPKNSYLSAMKSEPKCRFLPMQNKTKILFLLLCSVMVLAGCHSKQQPEPQQSDLERLLTDLVENRYAYCYQLTDSDTVVRCKYADEIMEKCDQLLASKEPYWKRCLELHSLMKIYDIDDYYGINEADLDLRFDGQGGAAICFGAGNRIVLQFTLSSRITWD